MTAAERSRHIPLDGPFNLREVGGYATASGRTRWGKLYRSDALHQLSDADREELASRGIGLVIDLRNDEEREIAPSAGLGSGVRVHRNPVLSVPPSHYIAADASLEVFYWDIIRDGGPQLIEALRLIASSGATPVLVHCTAGKDRTGIVIALALELAGVSRAQVIDDYARTQDHLPSELLDEIIVRLRATQPQGAVHLDELVRLSPPEVLAGTLARLDAQYGSVLAYALAHGLRLDEIRGLREALVETMPAPDAEPEAPLGLPAA